MLGSLRDDKTGGVESGPPGPPGDLVELPGPQRAHPVAVVLRQRGEQHRTDRHIHPDTQRVRTTDHLQQPRLRELLHQPPVFREHPGVMDADAVPHIPREVLAELGGEAEIADQLGDLVLLGPRAHIDAHQRLRPLHGRGLGEVHDVDRRLPGLQQLGERLGQRGGAVLVRQRHGPRRRPYDRGGPAGAPGEVLLEHRDIAERGRHQDELCLRQLQQRDLPGPAAVRLGIEMELVHHDLADVGVPAVAQRDGGEYLGGAADDRRIGVDRGVPGEHPDVLGAEELAQVEELLRHQRLDGRGIEGDLVVGEGGEVRAGRHQALTGAGGGGQDDVCTRDHFDQRLLLGRVERDALLLGPARKGFEEGIGVGVVRQMIDEGHAPILPGPGPDQGTGRRYEDRVTARAASRTGCADGCAGPCGGGYVGIAGKSADRGVNSMGLHITIDIFSGHPRRRRIRGAVREVCRGFAGLGIRGVRVDLRCGRPFCGSGRRHGGSGR